MIDPLSQTSYYLECLYEDKSLASGTCFFVKRNSDTYLITNWHNAAGRNPQTKEHLSKRGIEPTHLRTYIFKKQEHIDWIEFVIPLYKGGKAVWLEHPIFKEHVDVVAIKVEIPETAMIFTVEEFIEPLNENTIANVKDDVFVLGFPFDITAGGLLPIWKRASIASEPIVYIDGLPKMYIDTASRSGMSGSPVVYKEKRGVPIANGNPGLPTSKTSRHYMQFIGIYSGRIGADNEFKAQLGIVWKSQVINEIIDK